MPKYFVKDGYQREAHRLRLLTTRMLNEAREIDLAGDHESWRTYLNYIDKRIEQSLRRAAAGKLEPKEERPGNA